MRIYSTKARVIALYTMIGIIIGVVLLHPVTKIVYWFEFKDAMPFVGESLWEFLLDRIWMSFSVEMIPMSLIFAVIGGLIGLGFGLYHFALTRQYRLVRYLEQELAEEISSLINNEEGERLEFKSSVRWDYYQQKTNRALEYVIAKSISGFMNHKGGNLLIGIDDNRKVLGLEHDYQTLKHKNRDGFERCIMDIVRTRMGADLCSLVHCVFYELQGKDVCRIIVEQPIEPVYCQDGTVARYFLRTGNGTQELNVREAIAHVLRR